MDLTAPALNNTVSKRLPVENKRTRARARKLKLQAENLQEAVSASTQTSATIMSSENISKKAEPYSEPTVIATNARSSPEEQPLVTETAKPESSHNPIEPGQIIASKQAEAKPHVRGRRNKSSKASGARKAHVSLDDATNMHPVENSATAPDTNISSTSSIKPRRPRGMGRRGNNRLYKNKKGKAESDNTAQTDVQDAADSVAQKSHPQGNKHVSASSVDVQEGDHTTSPTGHDGSNESRLPPVNTSLPMSSRMFRMAPVVLPRLLKFPQNSASTAFNKNSQSSSRPPSKPAKDFAKDIPQMTQDLKRVIEKQQKRTIEAATNDSGVQETAVNNNPDNLAILKTTRHESAISQSLPNTPADVLTLEEWKQLPLSKRYALLSHKEKLAILTIETIPQILLESSRHHATVGAIEVVSPRQLPASDRMAFIFARVMALARNEAENGRFNWSTKEQTSTIHRNDVMSRVEVETFVTGMQEVRDPDRGGRVVMRRYWRLVGGLESGDGVGGVVAACSKEEKYLGRPSIKLKAKKGGVEAVLVCEVEVDEGGVAIGREWNEEE